MNTLRQVHAACVDRLRQISMPEPFDLDELCRRVAEQRGRPLSVVAWPRGFMPSSVTGSCMPTGDGDVIYHQPWATGLHRTQIVLHEIAHLVCGHLSHAAGVPKALVASGLLDQIDPDSDLFRHMFARHDNYGDEQEQEAEVLASLMLEYALAHPPNVGDPLVSRLHAALAPAGRRFGRG
jgi:hypothetical protein